MTYINTAVGTNIQMSSFTVEYSNIVYDASGDVQSARVKVNGNVEGVVNGKSIKAKYEDYIMEYSISANKVIMTMNGKVTTGCISSGLEVSTTTQMDLSIGSRCVTTGEMRFTDGISVVKIIFSNGSMTVYLNNQQLNIFNPCTDAEGRCGF